MLGEIYQFDEYGTQEFFMKCPPFGCIMKEGMSFNFDYNWLMFVIKECYQKRTINNKLLSKYEEITKELTTFSWPYPIDIVYPIVIEFIDIYNDKRNQKILSDNQNNTNQLSTIINVVPCE